MAAADSGIDPRYAAQFQRGYDPASDPAPPSPGPLRITGGAPAVAHRVPDPPRPIERLPAVPMPVVEAAVAADDLEDVDPMRPRPRLEWAVLGAGILLIVLAGAAFQKSVEVYTGYSGYGSSLEDQLFSLVVTQSAGPLLVAGAVAICLWIVLRAVRAPRTPA
jgi:hypothetical protein